MSSGGLGNFNTHNVPQIIVFYLTSRLCGLTVNLLGAIMAKHLGIRVEKTGLLEICHIRLSWGLSFALVSLKGLDSPCSQQTTTPQTGKSPVFNQTIVNSTLFKHKGFAFLLFPSKCVSRSEHKVNILQKNVWENIKIRQQLWCKTHKGKWLFNCRD